MTKYYYLDGSVLDCRDFSRILHRLDGPAIDYGSSDIYEWYQNGLRHRLDGPAIVWYNFAEEWYQNGLCHRLDGPAVEYYDGEKQWYQNGLLHRLDGPAIECKDGSEHWCINGKELTKEEFEKTILIMQLAGLLDG